MGGDVKFTPGGGAGGGGEETGVFAALEADGDLDRQLAWKPLNDLGNAARLRARHGHDLIYVRDVGWHAWDGRRWNGREGERMAHLNAQRTAEAIRDEAGACPDRDRSRALAGFAKSSGDTGKIAAMQKELRPLVTRDGDAMDAGPYLFNVANGTLELGEEIRFREHARDDRLTHCSPVVYDPDADYPVFKEFLDSILPDEIQNMMRIWYGINMTGDISEQKILLLYGTGSNGKSTLMEAAAHVLGDYALTLPFQSLLHNDRKGGGDASPDLAQLPGKRAVSAAEPDTGSRFSESILKTMTGGDKMSARHLQKAQFQFRPQFKLTLAFNNRPAVRGGDNGIWRRLLMVPFAAQITDDDIDKHLPEKLVAEGSGILNWMLSGVQDWFRAGLPVPAAVQDATQAYRSDSDPVGNFLTELTFKTDPTVRVQAKRLYGAFQVWCKASGLDPMTSTAFGRRMTDKGVEKETVGVVFYKGIDINQAALDALEGSGGSGRPSAAADDPGPVDGEYY